MIRVTADIYSGRPNPTWIVEDEAKAREILKQAVEGGAQVGAQEMAQPGQLGFRGFVIESTEDDLAKDFGLETGQIRLASTLPAASGGRALVERLIREAPSFAPSIETLESIEAMEQPVASLQEALMEAVSMGSRETVEEGGAAPVEIEGLPEAVCRYERGAYNPGFWNNDPTVRANNNCYNYASNKRTNTFAQPGRGCGNIYKVLNCAELTRASLCDGLHRRYDCFPESERPRYLVALVIWPGRDFHWYRLHREGFWGHKPGSTAARNVDNAGRIITNPQTADRGPYTQFCGYFYTKRTQKIR